MPINRELALQVKYPDGKGTWDVDDVILYHLGLGAGNPPCDPNELQYTYEKNLKVLPTYAVVAPMEIDPNGPNLFNTPGLTFDPMMMLHGEQDVEIYKPLPPKASYTSHMRIADIFDKGKAALLILEINARDEKNEALFTTRMSCFLRGEGGFGGPPGPKVENVAPDRQPDGSFEINTLPQQALLYRLNGDKNPLHADPEFAKMAGFDKPIIHGLCSYGITCKAIVDKVLGGDVNQVQRYQARFAGIAFPGETYVISYWREGKKIYINAKSKERNTDIINNAAITLR